MCGLLDSGTKYYDLTPYKNSNLRIRFGWITDDFFSDYLGGAVDNVQVLFPLRSEGSYAFEDGTSMAAPFVSGLAGLLWSYKPELSMREVRNLILNTGDYLPNLYGKVATGRRINVHKALLYFDQTNPIGSIKLNNNATYTTSPLVNLNLSGYDPDGGIQYVRFSNNGTTWTGWRDYANLFRNWSLTSPLYGGSSTLGNKIVYAQFKDYTGKKSAIVNDKIYYDSSAPSGLVSISNGGTYTKNNIVRIDLTATDAGSGVQYVKFSNNGRRWTGWKVNPGIFSWNLTDPAFGGIPDSGLKTLYVLLKDFAGNEFTITDTIKYDAILPTGTILISNGDTQTNSASVSLQLSATDVPYYVTKMRFSNNGVNWSPWIAYSTSTTWSITNTTYGGNATPGLKWVYVQYLDKAGNISVKRNDSINFL